MTGPGSVPTGSTLPTKRRISKPVKVAVAVCLLGMPLLAVTPALRQVLNAFVAQPSSNPSRAILVAGTERVPSAGQIAESLSPSSSADYGYRLVSGDDSGEYRHDLAMTASSVPNLAAAGALASTGSAPQAGIARGGAATMPVRLASANGPAASTATGTGPGSTNAGPGDAQTIPGSSQSEIPGGAEPVSADRARRPATDTRQMIAMASPGASPGGGTTAVPPGPGGGTSGPGTETPSGPGGGGSPGAGGDPSGGGGSAGGGGGNPPVTGGGGSPGNGAGGPPSGGGPPGGGGSDPPVVGGGGSPGGGSPGGTPPGGGGGGTGNEPPIVVSGGPGTGAPGGPSGNGGTPGTTGGGKPPVVGGGPQLGGPKGPGTGLPPVGGGLPPVGGGLPPWGGPFNPGTTVPPINPPTVFNNPIGDPSYPPGGNIPVVTIVAAVPEPATLPLLVLGLFVLLVSARCAGARPRS